MHVRRNSIKRGNGFTLIEMMITVAIIAILASIALPAYTDYVTRARIAEATASLTGARINMEQYFQDNRTYVGGPVPGDTSYFTYAAVTAAATYTITATGVGGAAGFVYTIDQSNAQTSTAPTDWGGGSGTCWVRKKGETC